ncbi:MAG: tRNA pseudouridine(55) synthase TruB [Lachnospiraceae bacterium]|nr:tRNA pseudouridine(55) synthase TruB [Candidatus Colinaster scatohippi]
MNNNINGIINVYKEAGYTSFDVVAKMRGIAGQRKIGHTGTLDPDATGVLPIVLGNATKLVDMLTEKNKEYVAEFVLGKVTDTQDISGEVLRECEVNCEKTEVEAAIKSFVGDILQIPPMYSAIKVDGKRLYELAREGKEVERKARAITIHEIDILTIDIPNIKIRVNCSKGTYIRTLCNDIGEKLGCGATMTSLERTASGRFGIKDAYKLSELQLLKDEGRLTEAVLKVDKVFEDYAAVKLSGEALRLAKNGNILTRKEMVNSIAEDGNRDCLRVYDENGDFFALYRACDGGKRYKADKMFPT